ncbi:8-oxo-dGTP diphosphatase [Frigoribacterium sp. PhB24]|uniref:8-oxo-dGTP diphosphatase n=1 Tax=Frigoribacterium sp. PhB24 TaxID=2485204 RepID=UPI000F47A1E8|nr:8-oxo-dGTP diphosphatase [Frigoribacterium sp. PhB24]ROS48497.1 8-oxo-dGTP diphosphatase [Frigoribacterium sp. PhB24]
MPVYRVCVTYLLREHEGRLEVLLGRKKRGLGTGRWVGLGGKLEPGERVEEAAVREVAEESGVEVAASDLDRRGDLLYLFPHRESWSQRSTVFVGTRWQGEPVESDELAPRWFGLDDLPLDEMWDDASRWLPGVLAGGRVARTFVFAADLATVASEGSLPEGHAGP